MIKNKSQTRKKRTRYKLSFCSSNEAIRISYHKSNKYLTLQAISYDGTTLTSLSTSNIKYFQSLNNKKNKNAASELGRNMANLLKSKNIEKIYFDRGQFQYHGVAAICADNLRNNGFKF